MTPNSARTLAAVHSAQGNVGKAAVAKRARKRQTLRRALQKIKDEPRRFALGFAARRAVRQAEKPKHSLGKSGRFGLLLGTAAMTVAAHGMVPQSPIMPVEGIEYSTQTSDTRKHASKIVPSDELMEALAEEEGVRYTVYRDVAGYPTVGVGHLVLAEDNLRVGDTISHERAMQLLKQDLAKAATGVRNLAGDLPLYQHEFDALVDLVYNVGEGNVSERESPRLNAAIDRGDYQGIADELEYTAAGGKTYAGLENRSERRSTIFLEGNYDDPREASRT